ncbi:MAG: lipoate protein ligase C-terminal domain-containing protein [Anaerolineae bacterium]
MRATRGPLSADHKVTGGKLLRVRLTLEDAANKAPPRIHTLRLTGDFFMHPEDAIEELEARLIGTPWQPEAIRAEVRAFFASDVQVIGADVDDIVHVVMAAKAVKND